MLSFLRRYASRHALWTPATRVVAAVSGGSDSVAMLLLLSDLHAAGELRLDAVAHFNHRIRPEAGDDEAFCRTLAERLGLPFVSDAVDVPALGRRRRQSLEVAARIARHQFFDTVLHARGADSVATAHTLDDQAETVLLRLVRGSGARGLSGIAPFGRRRIRPLLWATREALRDELRRRGQEWREDATNRDLGHPRNRVRHELLPYLEDQFNPSVRRALARSADLLRADDAWLARESAASAIRVVEHGRDVVRLDRSALMTLAPALRHRIVQDALGWARPHAAPTLAEIDAVLGVAAGDRRAAQVSRTRVEHSGRFVVLVPEALVRAPDGFRVELPVPGQVVVAGWSVAAEGPYPWPGTGEMPAEVAAAVSGGSADTIGIAADEVGDTLLVRQRAPGDRLRPLRMAGRKKVQDVLVDRKVPRAERGRVPVVTDAQGRIVWVAGHVLSAEFRVTAATKAVIILKLRRI